MSPFLRMCILSHTQAVKHVHAHVRSFQKRLQSRRPMNQLEETAPNTEEIADR